MNESEIPIATSEASTTAGAARVRRRPPGGRKAPARPKAARRAPAAAKRRPAAGSRSTAARRRADLSGLIRTLAGKTAGARGRLAAASGESARATRQAWQKVSGASRRTIDRLLAEWKQMDPARKTRFIAALLTALAAASTPIVRRGLKKR